jgi:uncharacterized BrkB/YihY/UPF0761 family membrane protein
MIKLLRFRFWLATTMAVLSGILSILTTILPEWIENVFGVTPDGGDGSLEWLIVLLLFVATILFFFLAYREWWVTRSALHSGS